MNIPEILKEVFYVFLDHSIESIILGNIHPKLMSNILLTYAKFLTNNLFNSSMSVSKSTAIISVLGIMQSLARTFVKSKEEAEYHSNDSSISDAEN